MPLTAKGQEVMARMKEEYGSEEGERVFYASKNKGTISGVDDDLEALDAACLMMDAIACDTDPEDKRPGAPPYEHRYNREAVNKGIAASNRRGERIGGKEAKLIHALLKGRQGRDDADSVAFEEGAKAHRLGKLYLSNPYQRGTQDFKDWARGYTEAGSSAAKRERIVGDADDLSKLEEELKELISRSPHPGHTLAVKIRELRQRIARAKSTKADAQFSSPQIEQLRKEYGSLERIDPTAPAYQKLVKTLNSMDQEMLKQLEAAGIRFVSALARNRVVRDDAVRTLKESTLRKWLKDGVAEIQTDLKVGKHIEVVYRPSGKRETVYVAEDSAAPTLDDCMDRMDQLTEEIYRRNTLRAGIAADEDPTHQMNSAKQQAALHRSIATKSTDRLGIDQNQHNTAASMYDRAYELLAKGDFVAGKRAFDAAAYYAKPLLKGRRRADSVEELADAVPFNNLYDAARNIVGGSTLTLSEVIPWALKKGYSQKEAEEIKQRVVSLAKKAKVNLDRADADMSREISNAINKAAECYRGGDKSKSRAKATAFWEAAELWESAAKYYGGKLDDRTRGTMQEIRAGRAEAKASSMVDDAEEAADALGGSATGYVPKNVPKFGPGDKVHNKEGTYGGVSNWEVVDAHRNPRAGEGYFQYQLKAGKGNRSRGGFIAEENLIRGWVENTNSPFK